MPQPVQTESHSDLTRERLLDEAERLFADRGFHAVSIREVTSKAGCNLAAVNYHFGGKKNLYLEVFRSRWIARAFKMQDHFRNTLSACGELTTREIVRSMASAFLSGPLSDEERARHHLLMIREMSHPTEAFDMVSQECMRPFLAEVGELLQSVSPVEIDAETMALNLMSVVALIIHFNFGRLSVSSLTGREYDDHFKVRIVEHIADFALQGLGCLDT